MKPVAVGWSQAMAWRMRRHLLDPIGTESVAGVVRRLGAVPSQPDTAAELAIRTRRQASQPGDVADALAEGSIIKSYAFRGATHLLTPEEGGVYLALRCASRMWELPSWQEFYGLAPRDWPPLRAAVQEALADGPLTGDGIGAVVTRRRQFRHLAPAFTEHSGTFLKPFTWHGDMCFGPTNVGRATFQLLADNPRWRGLPDLDEAGPRAVEAYFRTYGPATPKHLHYWLGEGLSAGRKRIQSWIAGLSERLVELDVECGGTAYILRDDLDDLAAAPKASSVRLLPSYDQWVLGPGTADAHIVPPARRALVTRGANLVIAGGVVSGAWSRTDDQVSTAWFTEAGPPPREALADEVVRLSAIVDRPLHGTVDTI